MHLSEQLKRTHERQYEIKLQNFLINEENFRRLAGLNGRALYVKRGKQAL